MLELKAKELMNTDLLFVHDTWSIGRLASFFTENQISGAPVITHNLELLGVVSVTDIFRFENLDAESKSVAMHDLYKDAYGNDFNDLDLKSLTNKAENICTVEQIMVKKVISVVEDTPLPEICRVMREYDIHRVFVTSDQRVKGVVTTSDILQKISEQEL